MNHEKGETMVHPCKNVPGGMALSTVLLNNCSNEVLFLVENWSNECHVAPWSFFFFFWGVGGVYNFESNLTCHD